MMDVLSCQSVGNSREYMLLDACCVAVADNVNRTKHFG